jgi:hypothetical protein
MPIEATCAECSRHYTLKEELAGKKIRCKSCEAVITVPAVKKQNSRSDDEFFLDDDLLSESDDDLDDDEDDYPRRRPKKAPATKAAGPRKRKRRSSSGNNPLGTIAKLAAGGLALAVSYFVVSHFVSGVMSGMGAWKSYPVPGAPGCTVQMPRLPKNKDDQRGNGVIVSETPTFACMAMSEAMEPQLLPIFQDLVNNRHIIEKGLTISMPRARLQGSRGVTINGVSMAEFTLVTDGVTDVKRAFMAAGRVITLDFICKKPHPVEMERYFRSFSAPGFTTPSFDAPVNVPAMAVPAGPGIPAAPGASMNPPANNLPPQNNVPAAQPTLPGPQLAAPPAVVETPADQLVRDLPVDPTAPANVRRSAWRYTDVPQVLDGQTWTSGVFQKKLGENWIEQRKKAATAYWNETARTAEYIELMKTDRSIFIRLFADRSEYRLGSETEFKLLFTGVWE